MKVLKLFPVAFCYRWHEFCDYSAQISKCYLRTSPFFNSLNEVEGEVMQENLLERTEG